MKFNNLKWLLKFKTFGPRCNIFMRMHCNIVALHAPDHVVVEPHTNILRANLFYFRFFFLWKRCSLFKMLALKTLTLLHLDVDENQETSSKRAQKHWVWPWLGNRQWFRCYYSLFQEIKHDTKAFKGFIKIDKSQF